MKKIVLLLLLIGGTILSTQAQRRDHGRGYGRDRDCGYRGRGYERSYRVHHGGRWEDCNRSYRGAYYNCAPAAPVIYAEPAPVVYVPAPPPRVVYHRAPRVVIATGPIVIGL